MMCDYVGCKCAEFKPHQFRAKICNSCTHSRENHRDKPPSSPSNLGSAAPQGRPVPPPPRPALVPSKAGVLSPISERALPEPGRKRSQSELPPYQPTPAPAPTPATAPSPSPPKQASRPQPPPRDDSSAQVLPSIPPRKPGDSGYKPSPLGGSGSGLPQANSSVTSGNPTPGSNPSSPITARADPTKMGGVPLLPWVGKSGIPERKSATMRPLRFNPPIPGTAPIQSSSSAPTNAEDRALPPPRRPGIPNHPPPVRPDLREGALGSSATKIPPTAITSTTKRANSAFALVEWGRLKELKELFAANAAPVSGSGMNSSVGSGLNLNQAKNDDPAGPSLVLSIDEKGQTLLHVAATFGHTAIIDYLIRENDHDPNPFDNEMWTPLHCAANSGHLEACYQLIHFGTMVHVPVRSQSIVLHYLVSKIALKLASPSAIAAAAVETPAESRETGRVFSFAIGGGSGIKDGGNGVAYSYATSQAFGSGSNLLQYLRVISIAMTSFADATSGLVNHQNVNQETPLHKFTATWPMKTNDIPSNQEYQCRLFVIRLFLKCGADPTIRDITGKTPFDNLEVRGHEQAVNLLRKEFGLKKETASSTSAVSSGKGLLLRMSSQSLFSSRKMLKKELESVSQEEAKQIEAGLIAKGVYNFQAQSDSELSFKANQMMVILDHLSSGEWWLASIDGVKGWIPSKFVQILHSAQQVVPAIHGIPRTPRSSAPDAIVSEEEGKKNETVDLLHVVMRLLDTLEVDEENFPILEEAKNNLSLAIASAVALEQQASMYWKTKIQSVIRVQALFRGMLARQRFREILRYIKLPKGPTEELLQTERVYLSQLQLLTEKFIRPVISKNIFKMGDETASMLGAVDIIMETNKTLLQKMESYFAIPLGQRHQQMTLGKIFTEMAPYFKSYNAYVEKYDPNEIRKIRTKVPAFDDICKKFNAEMQPYLIEDYLAKPMQRSLRYSLLLREILKSIPEDHVEYPTLAAAVTKWQELANQWNERRRRVENQHEVVEIQRSIEGLDLTLVAPSRTFVRKGEVTLYAKDGPRPVQLYLFNDILVLANIRSKKRTTAISYLNACYLQSASIFDLPDIFDLVNAFQLVFRPQKKARYRFYKSYTLSTKDKKEWMSDILSVMEQCKKSDRREQTREGASLMEGTVNIRTFFSWRARYGVLRDTKLLLYASEKSKLLESIELHAGFLLRSDEAKLNFTLEEYAESAAGMTPVMGSSEKPLATYLLKANSQQEFRKWIASLREAIAKCKPGLDSNFGTPL